MLQWWRNRSPEGIKYIMEDKYMAYVITDECLSCGTCAANCPAEAITQE